MRNTRKSGQILRSKNRPRPTLRSGRGSRTNSNTSHQIPARVIEADSARAVCAPDPRLAQLIQPGAAAAENLHGDDLQGSSSLVNSTRPEASRRLRRIVLEVSSGTNQSLPVGAPRAGAGDLTRNSAWPRSRKARSDRSGEG